MIRNRRSLILALGILALIGMGLTGPGLAQEDEFLLPMDEDIQGQRPPVTFSHDLHMDLYDCLDCHHDYEDGVNVLDENDLVEDNPAIRCASCHDGGGDPERREAYHRQCIGCHIDTRKAGQVSGPEMCGACHQSEG